MASAAFVFVTHQIAMTRWLKAEVRERASSLHFAFARPGLSTFKISEGTLGPEFELPSSFARAYGLSLGRASSAAEVLALVAQLPDEPIHLHVFEREIDVPVDEQDFALRQTRATVVDASIRNESRDRFLAPRIPALGELVVDVVVAHPTQPDDGWLVGYHRHHPGHGVWPGGVNHVSPPPESPSRAWCKIEEVLRWADFSVQPGDDAIEIGSAPGGASYALLCRGANVYGIDPGMMDPRIQNYVGAAGNRFVHLHKPAAEVQKNEIPRRYQWLLCDVNLAPMIALRYIERFVALAHGGLRGAALTLKLNDDGVAAALPSLRSRISKLGAKRVEYTQVPSHRSEIVAILRF
jgi:23S rRNA (cytidine2498-2'-O)-methyltransferase